MVEGGRPVSTDDLVATALATPMRVAERTARLLAAMGSLDAGSGVDALLVTDLRNLRYLTGFTGSAGLLAVTPDELTLVTDGRYGDRAYADLAATGVDARIEVTRDHQREAIAGALRGARRIGLEADSVTWSDQRRYATEWFAGREVVATSGVVERLRFVKDEGELARIRAAAAMADAALAERKAALADGPSERELQQLLDEHMRGLGSQEPAFPTIVASGPNAALPHHQPSERRIVDGDLVLVDFGGTVDGYRSDLSRTFMVGEVPAEARAVYDLVLEAQAAGVASVRDGVAAAEVDDVCRSLIEAAGRGDQFLHSTGHGVGLYIHEDPLLARSSTDVLAAGQVVTVEPGVYVTGMGGVRIEDLVAVTATGCEPLTRLPKSPDPT
jgi:Xaa-Pro aminopeptidase